MSKKSIKKSPSKVLSLTILFLESLFPFKAIVERHVDPKKKWRHRVFGGLTDRAAFLVIKRLLNLSYQDLASLLDEKFVQGCQNPRKITPKGVQKALVMVPVALVQELFGACNAVPNSREQLMQALQQDLGVPFKTIIADGTGLTCPGTKANLEVYKPHQSGNKVGLPQIRAVYNLNPVSSLIVNAELKPFQGPKTGEITTFIEHLKHYSAGTVWVLDGLFDCQPVIQAIQEQDQLFVINGNRRKTDFRKGTALGPKDCLQSNEDGSSTRSLEAVYSRTQVPFPMILRTNLTDAKQEVMNIYEERWGIETMIGNTKGVIGLDYIDAHTPEEVQRQWITGLLATNVITLTMQQGLRHLLKSPPKSSKKAKETKSLPRISFKNAKKRILDAFKAAHHWSTENLPKLLDRLVERISEAVIIERPHRSYAR